MSLSRIVATILAGCALLSACGQAGSQQTKTLTVLAAASLTESFGELGQQFQAEHPGVRIRFDYQGSSTLAAQINQGRPADVFVSADTTNMNKVLQQVDKPEILATNKLTIAVPKGNPAHIRSLADLTSRTVVVCAPQVPCGSATKKVEQASGVQLRPVSEENDVKSVLHKVAAGEADAGVVYVSDVRAAGNQVEAVDFPEAQQAINTYPIAVLKNAPAPDLAARFVAFVRGPAGREVLTQHGFTVK